MNNLLKEKIRLLEELNSKKDELIELLTTVDETMGSLVRKAKMKDVLRKEITTLTEQINADHIADVGKMVSNPDELRKLQSMPNEPMTQEERDELSKVLKNAEPVNPDELRSADKPNQICSSTSSCDDQRWWVNEVTETWVVFRCENCGGTKTKFRNQYPDIQ